MQNLFILKETVSGSYSLVRFICLTSHNYRHAGRDLKSQVLRGVGDGGGGVWREEEID